MQCVLVTVHSASVGPRAILGHPFLDRYGLARSPARSSLVVDDVPHEGHIPDEPSADVEDQHSGLEPEVLNLMDQDQLAESSPIFAVCEVSKTPHLQSQDLDINSDDADQSGPGPKRDPTPDAVLVTPEPSTRGGEEKVWDYYIDLSAVLDYPEGHHAKTEDGDDSMRMDPATKGRWVSTHPWGLWGTSAICVILGAVWRCRLIMCVQTHHPLNGKWHVPQERPRMWS